MIRPDVDFVSPDWGAPLDTAGSIAAAPREGTVKGLYFQDLVACLGALGPVPNVRPQYVAFVDYPLSEFMTLIVSAAGLLHPSEPVRSGLRLLGRNAYPKLASTLMGKAMFGLAGRDFGAVIEASSRAYALSVSPGVVSIVDRSPLRARVELRDIWSFPDTYQVGVFEGALLTRGLRGDVKVRSLSPCDADFEVTWE